jgi:hypothetical protein
VDASLQELLHADGSQTWFLRFFLRSPSTPVGRPIGFDGHR